MNTTIQIRIDKKSKDRAVKSFKAMGLDLSSGIKYLLAQTGKTKDLSYICSHGYVHRYTDKQAKEYKRIVKDTLKHGKKYTAKELSAEMKTW
jgi:addiction module RelB/DinJ family antitoxin